MIKDRDSEKMEAALLSGSKPVGPRRLHHLDQKQINSKSATETSVAGNANPRNASSKMNNLNQQKDSTIKHECHLLPIVQCYKEACACCVAYSWLSPIRNRDTRTNTHREPGLTISSVWHRTRHLAANLIGKMRSEASLSATRASGVLNPRIHRMVNSIL